MRNEKGKEARDLGSEIEKGLSSQLEEKAKTSDKVPSEAQIREAAGIVGRRFMSRIPYSEITFFIRQLIMLLESGVPLLRGLRTMSERTHNRHLRKVIASIADSVEEGNTLWQSFSRHPEYFSPVFVNLVKAGEASGNLSVILERVARYREQTDQLRKRLRSAMMYPLTVGLMGIAVIVLFVIVVIPMFEEMFSEFELEMPPITQFVVGVSHFLKGFWWLLILLIIALIVAYRIWVATPPGRYIVDRLKLRLPIFGPIFTKSAVVEFASTFGMLLGSGIPILAAIDLTRDSITNRAFARTMNDIHESVERGEGLETPLKRNPYMPAPVIDMLVTGEESGSLDTISNKIAEFYQSDVERNVNTLSTLIEPVMILCLGVVVLILILSFIIPYVDLITAQINAT